MMMERVGVGRRVGVRVRARRPGRLSFAAPDGAEDEAASGQERPTQQGSPASVAAKAAVRRVPVLALVSHLTCIPREGREREKKRRFVKM